MTIFPAVKRTRNNAQRNNNIIDYSTIRRRDQGILDFRQVQVTTPDGVFFVNKTYFAALAGSRVSWTVFLVRFPRP